ncbi:hypothetical protein Nepgr_027707 [Nepenthes gracilis]|uniref:Uncharacterized protein n=1 Tax=Nepenthes gracilis TaxID=150966 RepID=A0AAD3TBE9_NEPGR|nr:hypothetical protein Nepgr_027707 [Nepenthes gracilis]
MALAILPPLLPEVPKKNLSGLSCSAFSVLAARRAGFCSVRLAGIVRIAGFGKDEQFGRIARGSLVLPVLCHDDVAHSVEVEYQGKLSRYSCNRESGHNSAQCKMKMAFRPTGRILVAPHSRATQRSPKRNLPKIIQLSAQGDTSEIDHGSIQGEVSVGPMDPVSQDDCVDEIKPQNEVFREANEQLQSTHFSAVYPGHDAASLGFVVVDQKYPIGQQELQTPTVAGVHKRSLIRQEDISKERHHHSDATCMKPLFCQPVLGSLPCLASDGQPSTLDIQSIHAQIGAHVPLCGSVQQVDILEDYTSSDVEGRKREQPRFSSEESSIYSANFCDSTPNSIIKLSCKYAQDDFGTLVDEPQGYPHDGPDSVSQRGSLDGVRPTDCWSSPGWVLGVDALYYTVEVVLNSFAPAKINPDCVMVSDPGSPVELFLLRGISGLVTGVAVYGHSSVCCILRRFVAALVVLAVGGAIVPILLLAEVGAFTQLIALAWFGAVACNSAAHGLADALLVAGHVMLQRLMYFWPEIPIDCSEVMKKKLNEPKDNRASATQVSFGAADVPFFIQDPALSVLAENHQLDDMYPDDVVIDKSLAADSSPSPHVALADQHGKALGSAQLALVFHQERQQASFAEVLRRGLVATGEGLLGAAIAVPSVSVRVDSAEGFVQKSILKKSRRTKQKWSPRSANHV